MKIIKLTSQNVKRIRAVEIAANGQSVAVCGANDNGKSSVLDCIFYCLAGDSAVCEKPLRNGEKDGFTTVELDDYIITRTFTPSGGGTLNVMLKQQKANVPKPQTFLNDIIGNLAFDPLEFSRMKDDEQSKTLRKLVGLDFTAIDVERKRVYDERTLVNRDASTQAAKIEGKTLVAAPDVEIQVSDILAKKRQAEEVNKQNEKERQNLRVAENAVVAAKSNVDAAQHLISELKEQLGRAETRLQGNIEAENKIKASMLAQQKICNDLVDEDLEPFDQEMLKIQETNARVRANKDLREQQAKVKALDAQSEKLTQQIEQLDGKKEQMLAKANFPLKGLSFSPEGGVIYNNVPFNQASTARQLQIGAAIAMALNPKLRVMLIRDGSLLDDTSLGHLTDLAAKQDYQLWIERVGDLQDGLPGVLIEDGQVTESTINLSDDERLLRMPKPSGFK